MSGKAVRETIGFLAVVAGLVFVGLEIRQGTTVARAATRQALADDTMQLIQDLYAVPGLREEFNAVVFAEPGTEVNCRDTLSASTSARR